MMINQIKDILRVLYPYSKTNLKRKREFYTFKKHLSLISEKHPLKIVVGSGQRYSEGWIPSEAHFLDLLNTKTWNKYFSLNSLDALLAEHVWEHLTPEQGGIAARTCHMFLKKGGHLRVAVPDGFHPDTDYINYVKPGGHGAGADDHKILYNHKTFSALFIENGFEIKLLEYFDENGDFQTIPWNMEDGYVHRSINYDERNHDGNPNYTSLILDAYKK